MGLRSGGLHAAAYLESRRTSNRDNDAVGVLAVSIERIFKIFARVEGGECVFCIWGALLPNDLEGRVSESQNRGKEVRGGGKIYACRLEVSEISEWKWGRTTTSELCSQMSSNMPTMSSSVVLGGILPT